jgi:hypothetical protein
MAALSLALVVVADVTTYVVAGLGFESGTPCTRWGWAAPRPCTAPDYLAGVVTPVVAIGDVTFLAAAGVVIGLVSAAIALRRRNRDPWQSS